MRNLLIISRGNDKPLSQALIDICKDVRYIFLLAVEDLLGLLVQGIMFLDINDLQLVVHSFTKTEPFDHGVFVDTANGHSVGGLVFLFRHRNGRGGHMDTCSTWTKPSGPAKKLRGTSQKKVLESIRLWHIPTRIL